MKACKFCYYQQYMVHTWKGRGGGVWGGEEERKIRRKEKVQKSNDNWLALTKVQVKL